MTYLIVSRNGKKEDEFSLSQEKEYILGRGQDCDISLEKVKGLSREHLKIYFDTEGGVWKAELLSQTGILIQDQKPVESLSLEDQSRFSIPPYYFLFTSEEPAKKEKENSLQEEGNQILDQKNGGVLEEKVNLNSKEPLEDLIEDKKDTKDIHAIKDSSKEDLRSFSQTLSTPFHTSFSLRMKCPPPYNKTEKINLDIREKKEWIAGRGKKCDIKIRDKKTSRKHFKIYIKEESFKIEDLKSINGTMVGKKKLIPNTSFSLSDGDVIYVGKTEITVEIKNDIFSLQLEKLEKKKTEKPDAFLSSIQSDLSLDSDHKPQKETLDLQPINSPLAETKVHKERIDSSYKEESKNVKGPFFFLTSAFMRNKKTQKGEEKKSNEKKKKKSFFFVLIFIGFGVFVFFLLEENFLFQKTQKKSLSSQSDDARSEEQLDRIRDIFLMARKNFIEGKYELCSFEIRKLHKIVPSFENSKELESLCLQAFDLRRMEEEKERQEREILALEKQFNEIVEKCKSQITEKTTSSELKKCLASAQDIKPSDPLISDLIFELELKEKKKKKEEAKKLRREKRVQAGMRLFKKAEKWHRQGKIKKAVKAYKNFIESSFPDPHKKKPVARRKLASIISDHNKAIESLLETCRQAYQGSQFKKAFIECDKVLDKIRENEEAFDKKKKSLVHIQKKTKGLYIDSVLEESVGNLESAIVKWKNIIQISVPEDEYYERSKSKLDLYENRL